MALLVAAALVAAGGISSYAAKYVHQETKDAQTTSQAFYFTSDLLTSDGKKSYELPVGTTSITFELRNYADELRSTSESAIAYTYDVSKGGASVKNGLGSIVAGSQQKTAVTVSDLSAGTYTVTATSASPYAETLSATFTIAEADASVTPTVADSAGSAYATLTVSTRDYEGSVTVSWPAGEVIPDTTQPMLANAKTSDSSLTFQADSFSSYTFRFFKTNISKDYSGGDGPITAVASN